MKKSVYLDNAATTYPKAPGVGEVVKNYIENIGINVKRGTYGDAFDAGEVVFETRELICELFNFDEPDNVIFTMNVTQSLNYLIKEILKEGDHCIVSSMEHNAVMRPLMELTKKKIEISKVRCNEEGVLNVEDLKKQIKENTKLIVMTHASNVCGTILPLEEVGRIAKENNILFVVDAAQTAGVFDLNFKEINADAIAFTGHKGLLGPQGTGGFVISKELSESIDSLICGGTGSDSKSEYQPDYMPDKFEPGTMNLPGIFGLNESLKYLKTEGIDKIRNKELELTKYFIDEVKKFKDIRIVGLDGIDNRTAVVSLDFLDKDNGEISYLLDSKYNIMTRCGLHCAPSAHQTLNTYPDGTVRFSFSHFNTREEIEYTINAIKNII